MSNKTTQIQMSINFLKTYINSKKNEHRYTMLEDSIETILRDYKSVKQDLNLKNEIIIKLAIKGIKDE